jgi:hypothetical protein
VKKKRPHLASDAALALFPLLRGVEGHSLSPRLKLVVNFLPSIDFSTGCTVEVRKGTARIVICPIYGAFGCALCMLFVEKSMSSQ